ncbi:MAG: ATP-binding protein [Nitrospirota bacterium]
MPVTNKEIIYRPDFFENILRHMVDILIVVNPDATVRFINQTAIDALQYSIEDIDGMPVGKLFDDGELHLFTLIKKLVTDGELRNKGMNLMSKDGSRIPVVLNGSLIRNEDNKIDAVVLIARDMRDIYQLITELSQLNEDLEERVKNRTDELRVARDSSEEALKILQQTQAQLVQNDKMASVGQLSAGIAHEINNPTGFVLSNLKTLEEYINDIRCLITEYDTLLQRCIGISDEDVSCIVKNIEKFKEKIDVVFLLHDIAQIFKETQDGMRRISKIVRDMKEFSHAGSDKPEYTDVNKGLESTLNIVWNEIKYKAEVKTLYGDIPQVLCYSQQLNQVFMNILVNAAHAIEGRGVITLRTFSENGNVVIEISDTGKGISPEHLSRIFEPFFTTKPVGMGTGLGLSVAYAIIKKHNGEITVDSKIGAGTRFQVCIPVEAGN